MVACGGVWCVVLSECKRVNAKLFKSRASNPGANYSAEKSVFVRQSIFATITKPTGHCTGAGGVSSTGADVSSKTISLVVPLQRRIFSLQTGL